MTDKMIEIPEANHAKATGIRGLKQIATQSLDDNTLEQRQEIITRYFSKFQRRMEKAGTPVTDAEEDQIREELFEIITRKK